MRTASVAFSKSQRHVGQVRSVGPSKTFAQNQSFPTFLPPPGISTGCDIRQTINVPHTVQNATMKIRLLHFRFVFSFFFVFFFFEHSNEHTSKGSIPHNQLILAICAVERNLNYVRQTGCPPLLRINRKKQQQFE